MSGRASTIRERGQVLPLFALFLLVLFGLTALAIDVSGALSARRAYRSFADTASLAGAQDLQQATGRAVSPTERTNARTHAMERLVSLLGATSTPTTGTCNPAADVTDCVLPGTGYQVSIKTPSPSCVTCDEDRSVQVTVRNPAYALTFARLFGQSSWDVASTSVAGLTYNKSYTIVTLRPPKPVGSNFEIRDIDLKGTNTTVNVVTGDVGTNANMEYSGLNARLILDPAYDMWYYPEYPNSPPLWGNSPPAETLSQLIADPLYRYPSMTGVAGDPNFPNAPVWTDARESQKNLPGKPVTTADVDANCLAEWNRVDKTRYALIAATLPADVYCYEPGIYDSAGSSGAEDARIEVGVGHVAILKNRYTINSSTVFRGAYYLKRGLLVRGSIIGGYHPNEPGVAVMFDECSTSQCDLDGNSANVFALNAGTRFPATYTAGSPASAAIDWSGARVETTGPTSPTPALPLTLLVQKDPQCTVPTSPPFEESSLCTAQFNTTVKIAGSGSVVLWGVQYMPTDNATITGNSASEGRIGQLWAWTLTYSGNSVINQEGADSGGPGILRLDAACTVPGPVPPGTVCNDP
jgi:Flp pilus assembly protein TadG